MSPQIQELIEGLIAEFKQLNGKQIPLEFQMWTLEEVADYITLSPLYTKRNVITYPTFPPVRPIPTNNSGDRYADRWRASEVIEWSLSIDKSTFNPATTPSQGENHD